MNIIFFGYADIGYEVLATLIDHNAPVTHVYTHVDNPHEPKWFRDVGALARTHTLPTHTHTPTAKDLKAQGGDMVICAYYRKLLPTDWLLCRPLGAYNIHGSLLPAFRGAQPTNWAVISGATQTGITLHKMSEHVDGGDIVAQRAIPITATDTAHTVMQKITPLARTLIDTTIHDMLNGTVTATPQNAPNARIYPRRTPADGAIDFRMRAQQIHNLVRGVSEPYPGAFFYVNGAKITVWETEVSPHISTGITGMILCEGAIKCADTAITILRATTQDGTDALPLLHTGYTVQHI